MQNATHSEQPSTSDARLPTVAVHKDFKPFTTRMPEIKADNLPSIGTVFPREEQCKATLPFTCFFAPDDKRCIDNIVNPFCTISRSIAWEVAAVYENNGGTTFTHTETVTSGISKLESQTMQHTAGISITQETGVSATMGDFGATAKLTISLNYQFTHSQTSSFTEYAEQTVVKQLPVQAYHAAVLFVKHIWIEGTRSDESSMGQVDFHATMSYTSPTSSSETSGGECFYAKFA